MKIGLVVESLNPRRGGVETWTWQFAEWLAERGHEVHVVARDFAPQIATLGIVPHYVDVDAARLEFAAQAERRLRKLRLDLVHDMGCGWCCDVLQPHGGARGAAFEQNLLLLPQWLRPLKRTAARWLPRYRQFETLAERQYGDRRRLFVAVSRMVARDLERRHAVPPERIRVVYNGVDVQRFSPVHRETHRAAVRSHWGIRDDEVLLLIVAHNFRLKGVGTLIRAAEMLRSEGLPVRVAVAGGKPRPDRRLVAKQASAASTLFLGPVDDPRPLYAAADIYVQPTLYDPCSLVVLEALASGLPVVTSRYNGAAEIMAHSDVGRVLLNPSDAGELVRNLRPLWDRDLRSRLGAAARELSLKHSLERNCQEMLSVYAEVSGLRRAA